jgi:histone arginine demethylase JMJD6
VHCKDDSPLYLFESSLEDKDETRPIIENYKVPPYFKDDLFKLAGEKKRPPYRWFIMGPERSGTTVHLDPLMTSAWNASLAGHKRWVCFAPTVPKSIVKGK